MYKLAIFLLLSILLYSKDNDYSIVIKEPFNDALFQITQDYDREISAVGFSHSFNNNKQNNNSFDHGFGFLSDNSNRYGAQIHLIKIDSYGEIKISTSQNLPYFTKAVSILKTPTNGYFIGGYTLDGSLLILKLDENANSIFTKKFGTRNSNTIRDKK